MLIFVKIGPPVPEKKIFEGFFIIYGSGGHLGHVTSIMSSDFHFLVPNSFHTKFGSDRHSQKTVPILCSFIKKKRLDHFAKPCTFSRQPIKAGHPLTTSQMLRNLPTNRVYISKKLMKISPDRLSYW